MTYLYDKIELLNAISSNSDALGFASIEMRSDREIVKVAVSYNGDALGFAFGNLRMDREIVKIAVSSNCNALAFASGDLRADREIVKIAISSNGNTLAFASADLRADREIVLIALSTNSDALIYASSILKNGLMQQYLNNLKNSYSVIKIFLYYSKFNNNILLKLNAHGIYHNRKFKNYIANYLGLNDVFDQIDKSYYTISDVIGGCDGDFWIIVKKAIKNMININ